RLDGERLGETRHAFEQDVPVGEEPDEEPIDQDALAHDHGGDLLAQPDGEARALAHALVDGGDAGVHEIELVTRDPRGSPNPPGRPGPEAPGGAARPPARPPPPRAPSL